MAAEHDRKQAEKACQRADELFLAGNISGAHRQVSMARKLCPSLPAAANALAAYEIHAAAAARSANWRAVLGMAPGDAVTQDAVKKQFRRLSLLVHPDKNRCAAAEGAFKLLRQACDVLSGASEDTSPYAAPDEPEPWWREQERREQERRREEARRARQQHRRYKPEPICAYKVIWCPFCKHDFIRACGPLEEQAGTMCRYCHRWLKSPWLKKPPEPPTKEAPPPQPKPPEFPCPAQCPECGTRYKSIVPVGKWLLRCKACGKSAMVDVQGPDKATARK